MLLSRRIMRFWWRAGARSAARATAGRPADPADDPRSWLALLICGWAWSCGRTSPSISCSPQARAGATLSTRSTSRRSRGSSPSNAT